MASSSTQYPPYQDIQNKPSYQFPYNQQNEWNYESNQIAPGSMQQSIYNTHSPFYISHKPQKPYNTYSYSNYDLGYSVTPSSMISNSEFHQPPIHVKPTTSVYQQDEYEDGYSIGSYQGIN